MTAMSEPSDVLQALQDLTTKQAETTKTLEGVTSSLKAASSSLSDAAGKLAPAGSPPPAEFPSLNLVLDQVAAERDAINAHTDSLTTKAGLVLGFAGILVGLSATAQQVDFSSFFFRIGLWVAVAAAFLAALALVPLSRYPKLYLSQPKNKTPEFIIRKADPEGTTRSTLLDFQIAMVKKARSLSSRKQWLVSGSVLCLFGAAGLVVAGTLLAGRPHVLW